MFVQVNKEGIGYNGQRRLWLSPDTHCRHPLHTAAGGFIPLLPPEPRGVPRSPRCPHLPVPTRGRCGSARPCCRRWAGADRARCCRLRSPPVLGHLTRGHVPRTHRARCHRDGSSQPALASMWILSPHSLEVRYPRCHHPWLPVLPTTFPPSTFPPSRGPAFGTSLGWARCCPVSVSHPTAPCSFRCCWG